MMKILRILSAGMLACLCLQASAQNLAPVPALQARVTDQVGMLNIGQRTALENVLAEHEQRSGNQIAILLINSTEPETIEQYSIRVADAWKLGRKGVDDGVLLLVAKNNSNAAGRLRIETGRGVQGVLTDAQSKRVLQDVIAPHFRQGDFYGGLASGISVITSLLDREAFPEPATRSHASQQDDAFAWGPFIFFAILILITIFRSRGGRGARSHGRGDWGNSSGVILGTALGHELGRRSNGGFGGFGGGRGGFGGGGGFSGGGGGFDGGGASGNW